MCNLRSYRLAHYDLVLFVKERCQFLVRLVHAFLQNIFNLITVDNIFLHPHI
jgi:hypothetical protein